MCKKINFLKKTPILFFSICLAGNSFAGMKFNEGDLNSNNEIIFTLKHDIPGISSYGTLFRATIRNGETLGKPEILTCYPEKMELIDGGKTLQIRNRYGIAWLDTQTNKLNWKESTQKIPETSMRPVPYSVSSNGEWVCFVEKQNYASGALTLKNVKSGKSIILDKNASFSYKTVPAKWQKDGTILLYEKKGTIYFCNPEALLKGIEVGENFRKIGAGTINSVSYTNEKYIVYIDGDTLYRISARELYTRGLYSDIIGKGTAIGRLPFTFNPEKDTFSVNQDLTAIVIVQNGKHFSLYILKGATSDYLDAIISRPYSGVQGSFLESEILWPKGIARESSLDQIIPAVWLRTLPFSSCIPYSNVYNINERFNQILEIEDSEMPSLSPDKSKCAFYSGATAYIYETGEWKRLRELGGERIICAIWKDNDTIYLGGERTIRKWTISNNEVQVVTLSQATNAQWAKENTIEADSGNGKGYVLQEDGMWREIALNKNRKNTTRNNEYRIFCGDAVNSNYDNCLFIRTLRGKPVTKPILTESATKSEAKKSIALIFDAYNNTDGLARILYELKLHHITGTFFLNGEFIRRYPNETRQISISDNDCASMFFTETSLTENDFIVDEEFIKRGLARNEDEFFKVTEKELSLLWHAPYYKKSERMVAAAKSAGYTYVEPSRQYYDFTTIEQAALGQETYHSPAQLIDLYMNAISRVKSGIIPITVGISKGTRPNYLYESLDLLISAILDAGFQIVPVKELVN